MKTDCPTCGAHLSTDDPRFSLTAAQLEEQGVTDFQLDYALRTLRRTGGAVIARRN